MLNGTEQIEEGKLNDCVVITFGDASIRSRQKDEDGCVAMISSVSTIQATKGYEDLIDLGKKNFFFNPDV